MSAPPIFIVGVPRSGTTLLASMLSMHSRLAGGPETAFFAALAAAGEPAGRGAAWPESAIRFAAAATLEGESLLERYRVEAAELGRLLAGARPVAASLLAALGELTAARAGKARWLEKSPVHLLYLDEIRRWFPDAAVVRIVRDPRDVARSLTGVPWGPDDLLGGLLYWRRFHERSRDFFAHDRLCRTVRYEELVEAPEATLRGLCDFVGERFESAMIAPERPTEGLVRDSESWKANAGGPLDRSRVARWCRLPEAERRLGDLAAGDLLLEAGYPLAGAPLDRGWLWLHPRHESAAADPELRRRLLAGSRLWPRRRTELPAAGLLVGDPDADDWLGRSSGARLAAAARVVLRVLGLRLAGRTVTWNRRRERSRPGGWSAGLLALALGPLTAAGADRR